jgi:hypothetical protein
MYNKIRLPKEYRFAHDSAYTGERFFRGSSKPRKRGKLCAQTHMLVVLGRPGDSIGVMIDIHGLTPKRSMASSVPI